MTKKNHKIDELKKLAKLGLTAGLLMSTQGLVAESTQLNGANYDHYLAGSCGGSSGGSYGASGSAQNYYQSQHSCNQSPSYQSQSSCSGQAQQWHPQSSCHQQQQYYQSQGHCAGSSQQQWHPQSSCSGQSQQWHPQGGCASAQAQPSHLNNWQAQSGCGGRNSNQANYATTDDYSHDQHINNGSQPSTTPTPTRPNYATGYDNNTNDQNPTSTPRPSTTPTRPNYATGYDNNANNQNSNSQGSQSNTNSSRPNFVAEADYAGTITKASPLTEKDLMDNVNAQSKAIFQSLSPEGKTLALKLANQDCKGKNDCKGQNSCKTAKNECAGKGGCKGQSPSNFKDKNVAIKVASMKMAEKRNGVLNK